MQDGVDKWMVGLGFRFITPKYVPSTASWRGNGISITDEAAIFFYQATQREVLEARIESLQWALNDYNMSDTDTKENLESFIEELEQQRQKGGDNK